MMPERNDQTCPLCNGSGYRIVTSDGCNVLNLPEEERGKFGVGYADRCRCSRERERISAEDQTGIPERFAQAAFDNFYPHNPAAGQVSTQVRKWARDICPESGLLLTGPPGAGKTHLAVAALRTAMARGFYGLFCDYQTMLNGIVAGWKGEAGEGSKDLYERVTGTDVLLIDDLGASRAMDWAEDVITDILTLRYNAKRPVIITTNLGTEPGLIRGSFGESRRSRCLAEVIGPRSASRLIECCKRIDMAAIPDYRSVLAKIRFSV